MKDLDLDMKKERERELVMVPNIAIRELAARNPSRSGLVMIFPGFFLQLARMLIKPMLVFFLVIETKSDDNNTWKYGSNF